MDKVIFLVESGDHKVKYEFVIKVVEDGAVSSGHGYDPYEDPAKCPHGKTWRIVPDGKVTPGEQSGAAPIEEWAQQLLAVDQLQINFDTLVQGALGEASGISITLDDNANGYGWYIDLTPGLNEEFLPTANPYEWKAKPGSEAEGKVDLLTVLLHEATHTLGYDHTNDSHAVMAPTLEPGIRRLPPAEVLDELQGVSNTDVAAAGTNPDDPSPMPNPLPFAGFGAFWVGRLRKSGYGYLLESVGVNNGSDIQYAVPASADS